MMHPAQLLAQRLYAECKEARDEPFLIPSIAAAALVVSARGRKLLNSDITEESMMNNVVTRHAEASVIMRFRERIAGGLLLADDLQGGTLHMLVTNIAICCKCHEIVKRFCNEHNMDMEYYTAQRRTQNGSRYVSSNTTFAGRARQQTEPFGVWQLKPERVGACEYQGNACKWCRCTCPRAKH